MKNRCAERKQMRTRRLIQIPMVLLLFLLCGCRQATVTKEEEKKPHPYESLSAEERMDRICQDATVSIVVASESDTHVYYVDAAKNSYIRFEPEAKQSTRQKIVSGRVPAMTKEELLFFYDYTCALPEPEPPAEGQPAFHITMRLSADPYSDSNQSVRLEREGWDSFPEGWETLIGGINAWLGQELLSDSTKPQAVTPEFLEKELGLTPQDLGVPGAMQKLIDMQRWNHSLFSWKMFFTTPRTAGHLASELEDAWYNSAYGDVISTNCSENMEEYRVESSSPEDLASLAKAYYALFDDDYELLSDDFEAMEDADMLPRVWTIRHKGGRPVVHIAASTRFPELFNSDNITVTPRHIEYRDGPEGQSHTECYYYHQSGNYVLFTDSWQDIPMERIWQFITM